MRATRPTDLSRVDRTTPRYSYEGSKLCVTFYNVSPCSLLQGARCSILTDQTVWKLQHGRQEGETKYLCYTRDLSSGSFVIQTLP